MRRKLTDDFFIQLQNILESEEEKKKILGTNKQCLTKIQIYEILKKSGFNIGYSTVVAEINKIKRSGNECFIRQHYEFGDRLEYDFGEVKLVINGITKKYYIAVLSSPAGNFRWCYLYDNCKKDVFLDSHVEFFKMIGGVWKELVYDNMRNVVSKFIGKNEKELNEDLIKMSIYYGFDINVTNAFSGNEKGAIIITTNLTFDRWEEIFKDAMLTGAMVDRLAYKAHILDISRDVSHRYEETLFWKENK